MVPNRSRSASLPLFLLLLLGAVAAPAASNEFARASDPLAKPPSDPPALVAAEQKPVPAPEASMPATPQPEVPAAVAEPAPAAASEPTDLGGNGDEFLLVRTLGGLGLVIGLIVLGFAAARRYGPRLLRRQPTQRSLKIIESLPVGDKRSISVIQVENMRLLIGNTQQQITMLALLPAQVEPAESPIEEALPQEPPASTFRRLYGVDKRQAPQRKAANIPPDLREKMRQLREAMER